MRPILLDLFCGAGGSAMGYYRAGFDWMNRSEMAEAIPPAYTLFIGSQLIPIIRERVSNLGIERGIL